MEMEPTVDSHTRGAILEALAARQAAKEEPKKSPGASTAEFDESTSFGTLLEQSMLNRVSAVEEDMTANDDMRTKAINESQVDLVGDIMKRLL